MRLGKLKVKEVSAILILPPKQKSQFCPLEYKSMYWHVQSSTCSQIARLGHACTWLGLIAYSFFN